MSVQTQTQSRAVSAEPPRTQLKPLKDSPGNAAAQFFGWFSISLGVAEMLFPKKLCRFIGAPSRPKTTRLMGIREIATGAALLSARNPGAWMKARVAGDALDLALLGSAFGSRRADRARLAKATVGIAAIAVADVIYAGKIAETSPSESNIDIRTSMAVNKSPEECYRYWRQFDNLPRFMDDLESVEITGEKTSLWKVALPGSKSLSWDAEITREQPGEEIAWQSVPGSDVENSGWVRFEPRLSGRGTIVRLNMRYAPPVPGADLVAGLLATVSEKRLREDLRRFKSVIESGEAPTTEGQSSGRKGENR